MSSFPRVGLIGVGTMGFLVAEAILKDEKSLCVFDTQPESIQRVQKLGALIAESPRALASHCDITLMLLPGPPQIESVVAGEDGILASASAGNTIVDMSTVDPSTTRKMANVAAKSNVDYLDAPILGRPSAFGNWVLPVGGESEVVDRCRPVLNLFAREVTHVGPLGTGNTLKLLNALMFSAINAMTAEMMAVCEKSELDPRVLFETITASEAATVSGLFKEVGSKIVERDFDPIFPINLLCKDNGLAIEMAKEFGASPVLASAIQAQNTQAQSAGLGNQDTSALVKIY
jgi:3-hydroxyisobutyrate dehydrogenase-like beta-hydroxyacid dehydrogenase